MKTRFTALSLLTFFAAFALVWPQDPVPAHDSVSLPPAPASRNTSMAPGDQNQENLVARRNYEVLRLADPATGRLPADIRRLELIFADKIPQRQISDKSYSWVSRGPANVGGRTRALALDISDPGYNTILAGGVSGGMWRSTDEGLSWTLTTGNTQIHHVSSLAQDTRSGHQNVWYYGTGEGDGGSAAWPSNELYVYPGDGVYKSFDGGQSWSILPATAGSDPQFLNSPWQVVWRLAVDTSETVVEEVYAATWGGIYRSVDGGESWSLVLGSPTTPAAYADLVISPSGVVYATLSYDGAQHGAFRSVDGVTWTDITPAGYTDYDRIVMAMAPSDEDVIWILVANTLGVADAALFRYEYLSGNGAGAGGWWQDRSSLLPSLPGVYGYTHYESQASYCQMLAVHPTDSETVYLGGVDLHRSTDGFQLASNVSLIGGWDYPGHHADLHGLLFRPGSTARAYTASDAGVHRTLDAGAVSVAWTSLNQGYKTSQFYTVAIDENLAANPVAIGGTQDNGSLFGALDLPGANWGNPLAGDGGYCAVADAGGPIGTYYMSYQQNYGVFRMLLDNNTGALQSQSRVDPPLAETSLWLKPYQLDPLDSSRMYLAADALIWRNSDLTGIPLGNLGTTNVNWSALTSVPGQIISALAMSRSAASLLYFGTASGQLYRLSNAATAPAGNTPIRIDTGANFPSGAYVSSIAVHPNNDQNLLVTFSNYNVVNIFHSPNGGATWTAAEGNLGGPHSPSFRSVAWMPAEAVDYCFVATSTGIYSTTLLDGATTVWRQEAADLIGNVVVDMLAVRPADGLVVAGTHGKGVVRGTNSPSAVPDHDLPSLVRLDQNVPNPFNPTTSISFGIPIPGPVTVEIYDLAGRRIRRLLNEFRDTGDHRLVWNGTDDSGRMVSSGTYLYRISSQGQQQIRSMTLVR